MNKKTTEASKKFTFRLVLGFRNYSSNRFIRSAYTLFSAIVITKKKFSLYFFLMAYILKMKRKNDLKGEIEERLDI